MNVHDRGNALEIVRRVLAADFACPEGAFSSGQLVVSSADAREGGRRYPRPEKPLRIATMGASMVVHCHPERAAWVEANLRRLSRDRVFSPDTIVLLARHLHDDGLELEGPNPNYVCSAADLRFSDPPDGVEIALVGETAIRSLYQHEGFPNALSYGTDSLVPDMLATVATRADEVLGIAGASADSDSMWQIGVDVEPQARSNGIGRALVSRLTREVLKTGRLPYYAHNISNVTSGALAMSVGYRLAWVELYGRDRSRRPDSRPRHRP